MADYENKGRSASDAGLQVKQQDIPPDAALDQSWKHRGGSSHAVDLDNSAELSEDEKMREAHRKIKAIMESGIDEGDLGMSPTQAASMKRKRMMLEQQRQANQNMARQQAGVGMEDLMDGLSQDDIARAMGGMADAAGHVATDLLHNSHQQNIPDEATMMAESYGANPRNTGGTWKVEKFGAKIKGSNKVIPVWKVLDESTGMEIPKPFRVQEPAERIATIINQTGNVNDGRIKGIIEAYDSHVQLMKKARTLRQAIKEGRQELRPKLQEVLGDLETVNFKLGI